MKLSVVIAMAFSVLSGGAAPVSAQQLRGFITAGGSSDLNTYHPAIDIGVLRDAFTTWVSAGAEADIMFGNGYVSGRGAVFGQANLYPRRNIRPFLLGGFGWGEDSGPVLGAGLEVWAKRRVGLRLNVRDFVAQFGPSSCNGYPESFCDLYLHGGKPHSIHQPSIHVGVVWH